MAAVSDDRWTCPHCLNTTAVTGRTDDCRIAVRAVREGHVCPPQVVVRGRIRTAFTGRRRELGPGGVIEHP